MNEREAECLAHVNNWETQQHEMKSRKTLSVGRNWECNWAGNSLLGRPKQPIQESSICNMTTLTYASRCSLHSNAGCCFSWGGMPVSDH